MYVYVYLDEFLFILNKNINQIWCYVRLKWLSNEKFALFYFTLIVLVSWTNVNQFRPFNVIILLC